MHSRGKRNTHKPTAQQEVETVQSIRISLRRCITSSVFITSLCVLKTESNVMSVKYFRLTSQSFLRIFQHRSWTEQPLPPVLTRLFWPLVIWEQQRCIVQQQSQDMKLKTTKPDTNSMLINTPIYHYSRFICTGRLCRSIRFDVWLSSGFLQAVTVQKPSASRHYMITK